MCAWASIRPSISTRPLPSMTLPPLAVDWRGNCRRDRTDRVPRYQHVRRSGQPIRVTIEDANLADQRDHMIQPRHASADPPFLRRGDASADSGQLGEALGATILASSAAPKETENRLHQIVTLRYGLRSTPAGTS